MIRLELGAPPAVLSTNGSDWNSKAVEAAQGGDALPIDYRHPEIRAALEMETHGKCAYCEGVIQVVSFAHIEHILPKAARPDLICEWANLTLACQKCNTFKRDYYSAVAPLLNPYIDVPEEHLIFYGPAVHHVSARGDLTEKKLKLNRPALLLARADRIRACGELIDQIHASEPDTAKRIALEEYLADLFASSAEFSACVQSFAEAESARRSSESNGETL